MRSKASRVALMMPAPTSTTSVTGSGSTRQAGDRGRCRRPRCTPVVLALVLRTVLGWLWRRLTMPIRVVLRGVGDTEVMLPLGSRLVIGGAPDDGVLGCDLLSPEEPLLEIRHCFPRRLKLRRIRSSTPARVVVRGRGEVPEGTSPLRDGAALYWVETREGRRRSLHIERARGLGVSA